MFAYEGFRPRRPLPIRILRAFEKSAHAGIEKAGAERVGRESGAVRLVLFCWGPGPAGATLRSLVNRRGSKL
jgi:hypothetical protein